MADRYWVGGTDSWDGTAGTKWATTSGGTGGASVPTTADDVYFDANSGAVTCTIAAGNTGAKSINCTGFTGELSGTANITVAGSITLVAGMNYTLAGMVTITGAGTITSAGKTFSSNFIINASGFTVQLADALTVGAGLNITAGTFTTNNFNVTANQFVTNNSNARTINLGSSVVSLASNAPVLFNDKTNLTFNAGTSQFNLTSAVSTTASFEGNGLTFYNVAFTGTGTGTRIVTGSNTINNLSIAGPASNGVAQVTFNSNQTINGTLSTTGTAGNRRVWFRSDTYGVRRTLTINSAPSLTDADFRDIIVNGTAAPISGTRIGNRGACAGITFSAPKTVYWNRVAGGDWGADAWATSSGGSVNPNNFPLPQDTAIIENTGLVTGNTIQINPNVLGFMPTVDCSTRTNAMTFNCSGSTVYGSWINGSGVSFTGTAALTFSGEGTKTITSAGKTFSCDVSIDAYGGTVELTDAFNCGSRTLGIANGTFDTKGFTVSCIFNSNNSNVRTIKLNNSTINASINGGAIQISGANLTLDAGTSQINLTATATFTGGGYTYNNVSFTSANGGRGISDGGNTFNNLTISAPGTTNLVDFTVSGNQTINGTLTINASTAPTRRTFFRSNTIGVIRTLTCNAVASLTDVDFRDITIAGSAAPVSGTRLGDCGGNSGINFPAPKTVYWAKATSQDWGTTVEPTWSFTDGGAATQAAFPLAQDTAVFQTFPNSGATSGITQPWNIGTINMSARTSNTVSLAMSAGATIYGNWINGTGTNISGTSTATFAGRGTQTFTSAGKTITFPITVDSFSGTFQLGDAYSASNSITLTSGTFDAVTYNLTAVSFQSNSSNTRTINMGSGLWTLTGSGNVWQTQGLTNFFKGTADILLSNNTTTARDFAGGGFSYNKLTIGGNTSTSTTTITGNNQFTELASTKTVAHTIALGTTAQTFGKWTVTGTAGNEVTLTGTSTAHILAGSCTSGIDYLNMNMVGFSAASPAEFYAGANSIGGAAAPVYRTAPPTPRTLYWVGGTGNWSDTARWSLSSGGAGGQAIPTSLDNVIFNSASNATAYTATIDANSRCNQLTISGPASGNVTLAGTSQLAVHGNITLPATGLTRTYTGALVLSGSGTGDVLTTNGVALAGITVNGVGCEWTLGSALVLTNDITVTNGSFATGGFSISCGSLISNNANSRTISLGSSTINLTGAVTLTTPTNLTFSANTSTISTSSTTPNFNGGGQTFNNVSFTSSSTGTRSISGANTFNNLTLNASATGLTQLSINANQTITGTFTCSGSSAVARGFVYSNGLGTTRTLTVGTLAANDCDFRDITIAGTAAGTAPTRAGDCGGNSGITFPAPKTVFYRNTVSTNWNNGGSWSLTNGGSSTLDAFPLAQDTAVFPSSPTPYPSSGNQVTINQNYNIGTIDMSARTSNTMTLATGVILPIVYGDWINGTGTTLNGTNTVTFSGRGTMTFTSAGKTITFPITVDTPTGTFQLGDAYSNVYGITLTRGTFDALSYNVTTPSFTSTGLLTRTLNMGSGLWTINGSGVSWSVGTLSSGLTLNKNSANILLLDTSFSSRNFNGGDFSYNKVTLAGNVGATTITFGNNNTFTELASTKTVAHTIALGTTTQRVGAWTVRGSPGAAVTVTGNTSNLIYTGSGAITGIDYLNVQGRVYGSAGEITGKWIAGVNSINSGSLGWEFTGGYKTVFITTTGAGTFTIPSDFGTLVSVECIGGGGTYANDAGASGGGGGAYAKSISVTGLSANGTSYVSVGAGGSTSDGGDTWFNAASNAVPTLTTQGALAKGGKKSSGGTGGAGGDTATSVGDVKYAGGAGGNQSGFNSNAGGGGAAGPGGAGGNGGSVTGNTQGGPGGGGGASMTAAGNAGANTTSTNGGAGGNGGSGSGGGAGGTSTTAAVAGTAGTGGGGGGGFRGSPNWAGKDGGTGSIWTQTSNSATAGPGGGGGGGAGGSGGLGTAGKGANYGGGGGCGWGTYSGGQGIIVFTYLVSGAAVLTATITEAYTSAEAQDTAANIFNASATENSTLEDVVLAAGVYTVDISEASTLADSEAASFVLYVSVTEPTTLANFQEFVNLVTASITESLNVASSQLNATAYVVSITEGIISVSDIKTAVGIYLASQVESQYVIDTANPQSSLFSTVDENINLLDNEAVQLVFVKSITENSSLLDIISSVKNTQVAVNEAISSISDIKTVVKQLNQQIIENILLADTATTVANFKSNLAESFTSYDDVAGTLRFLTRIVEETTLSDAAKNITVELIELLYAQAAVLSAGTEVLTINATASPSQITAEVDAGEILITAEVLYINPTTLH